MLAIGRGLMTNPDCLIMDEPSEGLAPIIIQGVWEAIGKLKEQGLSILLVEQNAALALKLVDYVHVISKGQVVYSGAPAGTVGQSTRSNRTISASDPRQRMVEALTGGTSVDRTCGKSTLTPVHGATNRLHCGARSHVVC